MGRWDTGAITTGQCLQVHIEAFTKHIKKGVTFLVGSIDYKSGASISVKLIKTGNSYEAELSYTKTRDGKKEDASYRVPIVSVPSNLGKGEVYYFLCPFSFKKCKTLYMGYGSLYFKSRQAYRHRIYYASQLSSHLDRHNDIYWRLERELERLKKKHPKSHYKAKPTKAQERIERLRREKMYHDRKRWEVLPKALQKSMAIYGLTDASKLF
jgi:hypothetical protein